MPKIVDRTAVRESIAAAAWRTLYKKGPDALRVRSVAAEAQLPVSTLRHYFPSQEQLLIFSMELITQRVQERLQAASPKLDAKQRLRYMLQQFLPLDFERELEMRMWLYFVMHAQNAVMQEKRAQTQEAIHLFFMHLIAEACGPEVDADYEANVLHALLDGLALSYLATHTRQSQESINATFNQYIRRLFGEGGPI